MKISTLEKHSIGPNIIELISLLVARIPWPSNRLAMAEVTAMILDGKSRVAESVFGWGRDAVKLGMNELRTEIVCINDLSKRRKPKTEEKYPEMLADIHSIMAPECQADPKLQNPLAYTNKTAAAVRDALLAKGWPEDRVPGVRTLSNVLFRQDYRLRTVAKTRVQKKIR